MTLTLTLPRDDASIAYAVEGKGPTLFLVGAPVGMSGFSALARALADRFTVITHDPRGIGDSAVMPGAPVDPSALAGDLLALIDHIAEPALIFGASGGAVTAMALLTQPHEAVRLTVAHEPPLFALLPDSVSILSDVDMAFACAERDPNAAMQIFANVTQALHSTFADSPMPEPITLPPASDAECDRNRFFLGRMAPATVHYMPDIAALSASNIRLAAGAASIRQPARRATEALGGLIGQKVYDAPGNHFGLAFAPSAFAEWLVETLHEAPVA